MGTSCIYSNGRYRTVRDFINKYIIEDFASDWGDNFELLDHSVTGNVAYLLVKNKEKDIIFIAVADCSKYKDEYCYKWMDDTMHPYRYDCPERMLKKTKNDNKSANEWYAACRKVQANRKRIREIIKTLKDGTKGVDFTLETAYSKRRVAFRYIMSDTYFAGISLEDEKLYKWRFNDFPVAQWEELYSKVKGVAAA